MLDGKIKRHHEERAATPCARLLARLNLDPERRPDPGRIMAENGPIELREEVETMLRRLWNVSHNLVKALFGFSIHSWNSDGADAAEAPRLVPLPAAASRGKRAWASFAALRPVSCANGSAAEDPWLNTQNHRITTPTTGVLIYEGSIPSLIDTFGIRFQ